VLAGEVFMAAVRDSGAMLLPIDSEHNAIFQCLPQQAPHFGRGVSRIVLTASGGPFRTRAVDTLADVTPDQACAHPNWVMGRKISVDSATMMNKGLEVIEAHWLFGVPVERLEVLIHPQSVIHSMVGYDDGSVLAQLGNPDMRTPIAYGLAYPERIEAGVSLLDLAATGTLTFDAPDLRRFPCLALAFDALRAGGTAPAVLNAANEVAVEAFLQRRIRFTDIAAVVADTLAQASVVPADSLDTVFGADADARGRAEVGGCDLEELAEKHGIQMPTVAHAGDGNLHPTLVFEEEQRHLVGPIAAQIFRDAVELGGTVSAEHGLGALKRDFAALEHSVEEIGWWRRLKDLYDPLGILNPHKIFPEQPADEHFLDAQPGWGRKLASGRDRTEVAT